MGYAIRRTVNPGQAMVYGRLRFEPLDVRRVEGLRTLCYNMRDERAIEAEFGTRGPPLIDPLTQIT